VKEYRVTVLATAYDDLAAILSNRAEFSAQSALNLVNELEKWISGLETMPQKFPVYEPLPIYRKMTVRGFLVFYTISEGLSSVEIHRILDSRANIKNWL
jgi:plasmid stabilization system protein ParE